MIVYAKEDIVSLSGNLHRNYWLTIKAAANLLLKEHPEGIIIDCEELKDISEDGAGTFSDAFHDIQAANARMLMTNLPDQIMEIVRDVPGVRSRVPIANSIEEARSSLRSQAETDINVSESILVPLFSGMGYQEAVSIGIDLARVNKAPLVLLYCLEVGRDLPLGTPLPKMEAEGRALLEAAAEEALQKHATALTHMERVRDLTEGILQQADDHKAIYTVLGVDSSDFQEHRLMHLIENLMQRSKCNVVISRCPPDNPPVLPTRKPSMTSRRIRGTSGGTAK
ncbi:MAG: universal stress protein [Armatimonadota bacterium]